ncbi:UNVERIFIED_CONTAM: hypothetical protein Sangu_3209000 [Sesamum angustifolium]|uniref:Uncharacterized protein n=1 Tax=Sesamum angustifolium TaxID=2727405 RepID=A0AAW2JMM1_9LAMI
MFLMMVILSPSNPKCTIDIYLESLIEELQMWHIRILTRGNVKNKIFTIRTAFMWTVNDLPAFGWSITGVMGYSICIKDTRAFYLENSRKACYFDSHRQFLPLDHPYRRNKKAFTKNRVERQVTRPRLTGEQIRN